MQPPVHAVVNALASRYAALDAERRVIQSTRSMEGRKRTGIAATKRKINEHKPIIKRRRKQGACKDGGVSTIEIVDDKKYDVAVANAVSFLEKIESADAEHTFLGTDTVVIHCEKCICCRSMISLCISTKVPGSRSEKKLEYERYRTSLSLSLACQRSHWWVSRRCRRWASRRSHRRRCRR
jgi:hypothetical protein